MVMISGSNTSPALTSDLAGTAGENNYPDYYRTAHNDLFQGAAAAGFALDVLGVTTAAAIHDGDPTPDLLAVKYLEALGTVADGRATKIFLPADMSATLGSLGAIAELFTGDEPEGDGPEASARDAAPVEPEDLAG